MHCDLTLAGFVATPQETPRTYNTPPPAMIIIIALKLIHNSSAFNSLFQKYQGYQLSINFVIFFLSYWGDVLLDEQVFFLAPNVFSNLGWLSRYHNITVKLQSLLTSKYESSIVSTELHNFFAMLTSFVNMNLKKLLQTWKDQGRPAISSK